MLERRRRGPRRRALEWCVSILGMALVAGLVGYLLHSHGTKFDGVWVRVGGQAWMPEEVKVSVRDGVLHETLPGASEYESYRLIADGSEHRWEEPETRRSRWAKFYTAKLEGESFQLTTWLRDASGLSQAAETERWELGDGGRELRISNRNGETVYRRASWLGRLLDKEP